MSLPAKAGFMLLRRIYNVSLRKHESYAVGYGVARCAPPQKCNYMLKQRGQQALWLVRLADVHFLLCIPSFFFYFTHLLHAANMDQVEERLIEEVQKYAH